jgi:hypothetical protein
LSIQISLDVVDEETEARAEFRELDVHAQIRQAAQPTSS